MLLTDLQTKVGIIAERAIPDAALLLAAQEVVNNIEGRNQLLVQRFMEEVALDGSASYELQAATHSTLLDIHYVSGVEGAEETWVRLVEKPDLEPAPVGTTEPLYYYTFLASDLLVLSARPTSGTLQLSYRLSAGLALTDDVDHPSLFMGTLAWFGRHVWQDQRTAEWERGFEQALKAELAQALRRGGNLGNLGKRN